MKVFAYLRFRKRKYYWLLGTILLCTVYYNISPGLFIDNNNLLTGEWQNTDVIYSGLGTTKLNTVIHESKNKTEITILRYTKYFGHYEPEPMLDPTQCAYLEKIHSSASSASALKVFNLPCRITFDRKYFNESDALVFHSHDLDLEELPNGRRNTKQLWVYLQQESPLNTALNLRNYPNTFNWTMTYRRDSDVYHPYAHAVMRLDADISSKIKTNKTGLVAWIVSNCDPQSKRQYFVYELQKYIPVDIFGWCGRECPSKNCYSYVAANYKFYLSFENSLCGDYITEKFFKALTQDLVPVVYGGGGRGSEDYSAIAPKNSYIDARSFKSPQDLSNYLHYLDREDDKYLEYFEWKNKYQIVFPDKGYWCNLCQRIYEHLNEDPPQVKWYKDLWKWWHYMSVQINDKVEGQSGTISSCVSPPENLVNFYPGFLKSGLPGQVANWMRKIFFKE